MTRNPNEENHQDKPPTPEVQGGRVPDWTPELGITPVTDTVPHSREVDPSVRDGALRRIEDIEEELDEDKVPKGTTIH